MGEYFGQNYEAVEYMQIAPAGDHMVTLGLPKIEEIGKNEKYRVVTIPVFIDGFQNHSPETWTMFDAPTGDLEKLVQWNKSMTQFFDAFGIPRGDFELRAWNGKRGRVRIEPDKGGYMKVRWAIPGFAGKELGSVPYEKVEPKANTRKSNAFNGNVNNDPLPSDMPAEGF